MEIKVLKKILSVVLCITILFVLVSCSEKDSQEWSEDFENGFETGLKQGRQEVFLDLLDAANFKDEVSLVNGKMWRTKQFTLCLSDKYYEGKRYLGYDLVLKDMTVEKCSEGNLLFFNAYYPDDQWEPLLDDEDYYWNAAVVGELDGNHVQGISSSPLPDDGHLVVILILIDGNFYYATYTYYDK